MQTFFKERIQCLELFALPHWFVTFLCVFRLVFFFYIKNFVKIDLVWIVVKILWEPVCNLCTSMHSLLNKWMVGWNQLSNRSFPVHYLVWLLERCRSWRFEFYKFIAFVRIFRWEILFSNKQLCSRKRL